MQNIAHLREAKNTAIWCSSDHTLQRLFKEADAVVGKFAYLNMYAVSITRL
jgi:hypothetical protein